MQHVAADCGHSFDQALVGSIPIGEYRARVARIAELLTRAGFDALVACASRTQYGAVRYLTGYEPWQSPEEWAFAVLSLHDHPPEPALISNSPWDFWSDAARSASTWVRDVTVGSDWIESIAQRIPAGARRVGVAGWASFPAPVLRGLQACFPSAQFADASKLSRDLRAIKSPAEIGVLEAVGRIGDAAAAAMVDSTREGASELEVATQIQSAILRAGATQTGYFTNFGSGPRTAATCFLPTRRSVSGGDVVQLDCAPMLDGYKGDISRAMLIRHPGDSAAVRLLETVADMYERCAERLRPGVLCSDVARVGLEVAESSGYSRDNLFKSANYPGLVFMGHGIGLENPDPPGMLTLTNHTPLEVGMVINLEPILIDRQVGGARIETAFSIEDAGARPLSEYPIRPWHLH